MYICFWSYTGLLILPLRVVLLPAAARQFGLSVVRGFLRLASLCEVLPLVFSHMVRIRVYASDIVAGIIYYVEPIVDKGPGSPSNCTLSSWETAAGRVVSSCGVRGELGRGAS